MNHQKNIDGIRARIATIEAARTVAEAQKRSRKECGAYLEAQIARWAGEAAAMLQHSTARTAAGMPAEFLTITGASANGPVFINLGPLAVMLLGQTAVRRAAGTALDTVPEGVARSARTRQLKELADALHVAQVEEENAIRAAEADGEIIPYRADADPEVTLTWGLKNV